MICLVAISSSQPLPASAGSGWVYMTYNASKNNDYPNYNMPNVARRLLESFLSFRMPGEEKDDLYSKLERSSFDCSKKTAIYRFVNFFSQ